MKKVLLSLLIMGNMINASDSTDSEGTTNRAMLSRYRTKNRHLNESDLSKRWFTRIMGVGFVVTGATMTVSEYFNSEKNADNLLNGSIVVAAGMTMLGLSTVDQSHTVPNKLQSIHLGN